MRYEVALELIREMRARTFEGFLDIVSNTTNKLVIISNQIIDTAIHNKQGIQ